MTFLELEWDFEESNSRKKEKRSNLVMISQILYGSMSFTRSAYLGWENGEIPIGGNLQPCYVNITSLIFQPFCSKFLKTKEKKHHHQYFPTVMFFSSPTLTGLGIWLPRHFLCLRELLRRYAIHRCRCCCCFSSRCRVPKMLHCFSM